MVRKNTPPDRDKELNDLIAQYETMRTENKQIYLDGDQLADIADKYAAERRFQESQEVITYGLSLHPGNTDLMVEQAYLYLDTQKVQLAKEVAESITETYETSVKLLKAELLLNEGKLDATEMLLDTIDEQDDLDTIIEVSYLYIDMGYPERALPWLTKGVDKYNEDEDFLAVTADCYCAGNKLEKAAYFYNKLIDINPYHSSYWLGLSKCQFAEQDYGKAAESIDFALAADEKYGEGHLMKAHCLFHLENEEEAIEAYEKALEYKALAPEFAYMFIGLAYNNKENWQKADDYFQRALDALESSEDKTSPLLTDIYTNKAMTLSKLGRSAEAHELCAKAKELDPDDSEPYLLEGTIYMEENDFDSAREEWEMALRRSPEAETWYQIGTYSIDYNMIENARFCFEQALKLNPHMEGINEQLASVCLILKDHKGFYKYNQLSNSPLDFQAMYEGLSALGSSDLVKELKSFMDEIKENGDKEEEEEEREEETLGPV